MGRLYRRDHGGACGQPVVDYYDRPALQRDLLPHGPVHVELFLHGRKPGLFFFLDVALLYVQAPYRHAVQVYLPLFGDSAYCQLRVVWSAQLSRDYDIEVGIERPGYLSGNGNAAPWEDPYYRTL